MKPVKNISESDLSELRDLIGEAFVTNELFHEFGNIKERRRLVMDYMSAYVDYVFESKALYSTDDSNGYIGLQFSKGSPVIPKIKMLCRLLI